MTMIYSNPARECDVSECSREQRYGGSVCCMYCSSSRGVVHTTECDARTEYNKVHAVPDVEVFYAPNCNSGAWQCSMTYKCEHAGWRWQRVVWLALGSVSVPNGEPNGPFATEAEAIADAQSDALEDDGAEDDVSILSEFRASDGRFNATIDGGYPIVYLADDGGTFCAPCANRENGSRASVTADAGAGWRIVAADVFYEGAATVCDHCGVEIESAYGDPDAEELPPCVLTMRCYCAGHARGNPASEPCDTNEHANANEVSS